MKIILSSKKLKICAILKPTSAEFFKDLKSGDCIKLSVMLKHAGYSSGGGPMATSVTIENLETGATSSRTFSQMSNRLEHFELLEVDEDTHT